MRKIPFFLLCIIFLSSCGQPKDLSTVFQEFEDEQPHTQILDRIDFNEDAYIIYETGNIERPIAIACFTKSKKDDGWECNYSVETFVPNETYTMAMVHTESGQRIFAGGDFK